MAGRRELSKPVTALLSGAGVALLVGLLHWAGFLDLWELKTRDLRTRWTLRPERDDVDPYLRPDILLVDVTDESLRLMDKQTAGGMKWPWDREIQAHLVKACTRGKAGAILYDFLINEAGRPEDEKYLVDAVKLAPPTYFAGGFREVRESDTKDSSEEKELLGKLAIDVDNDGTVTVPDLFRQVVLPTPRLCNTIQGVCVISTPRDEDGGIRRYRLYATYGGRSYPSFVLAALMAREKTRQVRIRNRWMSIGSLSFPVEADGSILIRYYPPQKSFPFKSAWTVIYADSEVEDSGSTQKFDFRDLEGKTVFFGTSAVGLTDLRVTPASKAPLAGVLIHMMALANVLQGDFLRESPRWISVLLFISCAIGVAFSTRYSPAALGGAVSAGALVGAIGLSVVLYKERWIVDLVPSLAAILLSYAATSAINFLYEGRQRLRIKRDFQRYMSPKVVEKILKNPDALSMKGEKKTLTVFFLDFKGFTAMSEKLDAEHLVELIDQYHNEASEEIFRTDGTLDKFIGDAIMAFWNDPISQEDHALRACLTAVGAQKRLKDMALKMKDRGLPEMSARIGINTGPVTVGNMGARNQVNYTVIGDEVNLASRLEGVNKEFGTAIIISDACYQLAKERVEVRELALIKVKGKRQPVRIFELLGLKGEVPRERLEGARRFESALEDLRGRRFQKAWEKFLALSHAHDAAAEPYLALCERYLSEPPPPEWDGSYQMETK
jgi:adenylate cyclase